MLPQLYSAVTIRCEHSQRTCTHARMHTRARACARNQADFFLLSIWPVKMRKPFTKKNVEDFAHQTTCGRDAPLITRTTRQHAFVRARRSAQAHACQAALSVCENIDYCFLYTSPQCTGHNHTTTSAETTQYNTILPFLYRPLAYSSWLYSHNYTRHNSVGHNQKKSALCREQQYL